MSDLRILFCNISTKLHKEQQLGPKCAGPKRGGTQMLGTKKLGPKSWGPKSVVPKKSGSIVFV
jgi:hypothetical protein